MNNTENPENLTNAELEEMGEAAPFFDEADQAEFEAETNRANAPFWK